MSEKQNSTHYEAQFVRNMVESSLRILLLALLLYLTYDIIKPFLVPVLWGGIIAIAAFPLTRSLQGVLGGRRGLASTLITVSFISLLVVPCFMLTESLLSTAKSVSTQIHEGTLSVPPPPASVEQWPVIGEKAYQAWTQASINMSEVITESAPQLKELSAKAVASIGRGMVGVLMFVISLIIAGGFMTYAESSGNAAHTLFVRLGGSAPGGEWANLTVATVRSVLIGVVGVAVIQSIMATIGLLVMGIPAAAVWAAIILFLAIAQLPPILIIGPLIAYAYSSYDSTSATIFTVWMLLAAFSDTFLKPILMGRGLDIPMPVILIGAIGGMLASGIIGLFAGAVVLSIWYKLFRTWLEQQGN